ncbi:uncharacterized protein LOC110630819 [Manihot esculenta]|uniref:Uncharacterized protein n=2 Tax=Manihot esculenta TaxID=3983 RepID=A0A2C9UKA7_MANES|nr:uncharacterized protein LOC110630819 [Manihot esculenta]KAG8639015.1 hypothetical protein MANES_14G090200v8 [Manihot esculenta]OAY31175.1 hypothetical protein MANES_14G090200v8 [Manihot esculenta]
MASPPPPPPPQSPPSASNSQNSATPLISPKVEDGAVKNGVPDVLQVKPELAHFQILDSVENMDKYRRYEADYTHRLMAKYFSKKNFCGGDVFDERMRMGDETIMSSRWPCTRSFADPVKGFEEQSHDGSTSEA